MSTENKNSVAKNYLYNLTYQVLVMIVPLITTPYISRILGATGIGAFGYAQANSTYFVLFGTIGSALYGQREIAYVQHSIGERTRVFKEIESFRIFTVCISAVVYWLVFFNSSQYQLLYRILMIDVIASAFDISWFFQGTEDFRRTVTRNIIIKLASVALIFLVIRSPKDVPLYAFCYTVPTLLGNLSLWLYLPGLLDKTPFRFWDGCRRFRDIFLLFIPQAAVDIYAVLDKSMLGSMCSDIAEVGFYTQTQKIVKLALKAATAIGIVMLPHISQAFAQHDTERIRREVDKSTRFVFLMGAPIMFGIAGIANTFVPWFYGAGYDKVKLLLTLMAPIVFIIGMSNVLGVQYLLPTKQQTAYTVSVIAGACVNFVLNFVLIPRLTSVGAVIGTIGAELTVTVVQMLFVRGQLPLRRFLGYALKYFCIGAGMGICVYGLGLVVPASVPGTVLQIAAGMLVYFGLLALTKDALFMEGMHLCTAKVKTRLGKNAH